MVYGHPVLIQDVGEDLDPSLAAIFRMTGLDQDRASMIQFGDKELSYNHNFRLYLTTKLQNPHYKPEVSILVNIVNFAVKEKGLQDQLLGIVVRMEEPKLENDKADLVRTVAAAQRKLVELEDSVSWMFGAFCAVSATCRGVPCRTVLLECRAAMRLVNRSLLFCCVASRL